MVSLPLVPRQLRATSVHYIIHYLCESPEASDLQSTSTLRVTGIFGTGHVTFKTECKTLLRLLLG